jgi:hypothetical protein
MPRLSLIALALNVLALGAGCNPSSYDDFRSQLQTRWCNRELRCGIVGRSETSHCGVSPYALSGSVDVGAAIGDGRMKFHPDNARECLSAIDSAPCDFGQAIPDFYRHCHGVLGPSVEVGGTCFGDEECVGGACIGADCGGTCVAFASPGAPCRASGGTPGETCDPTVQFCDGTCQRKRGQGADCTADEQCLFAFVCVDGKCADIPRVKDGDVCSAMGPPCQDGSYCDGNGLCAPQLAGGQTCPTQQYACSDGNTCIAGTCAPWLDTGGACVATVDNSGGCAFGVACSGGACGATPMGLGPLALCKADSDCGDFLYCAPGGFCDYRGAINAGCQTDSACVTGLACDATLHLCRRPVSCPAAP